MTGYRCYIPSLNPDVDFSIKCPRKDTFDISGPFGTRRVKSMLHEHEIAYLYHVARNEYSGVGEIVDLGPLLGVGTRALAKGIEHNPRQFKKSKRIWSYDAMDWRWVKNYLVDTPVGDDFSLEPMFWETNDDTRQFINLHKGDILQRKWTGEPIDVLFIDLAKSYEINDHIVREFFPYLREGATLIQQDYLHPDSPWLHMTMGWFADHFNYIAGVRHCSAVFRLKKLIPAASQFPSLSSMPISDQTALIKISRRFLTDENQIALSRLAEAVCLIGHKEYQQAQHILSTIHPQPPQNDPFGFDNMVTHSIPRVGRRIPVVSRVDVVRDL